MDKEYYFFPQINFVEISEWEEYVDKRWLLEDKG